MNYRTSYLFVFLSLSILFLNGCGQEKIHTGKLVSKHIPIETCTAGYSVKGKPITYTKIGDGKKMIFLFASIHGSERAGIGILNNFQKYIIDNNELLDGKTLIIMPVANPDGVETKTRYNSNNIDINRNFPAVNRITNKHSGAFALSEPESYALYKIVNTYKPSRIIAFHEALACMDYDGPAEELAKKLAAKCKLPLHRVGAQPGSLGSYAGIDLNIPIITVELTKQDSTTSQAQLWKDYKDMLIEAISY
jgi:protein MpaA